MAITDQALHVLVFARLKPETGYRAEGLTAAWAAAGQVRISQPLDTGVPIDLPDELPDGDVFFRVVAGKAGVEGSDSAIAFVAHDVVGIVVRLSASGNDGWAELSESWRAAFDPGSFGDLMGVVEVFLGAADQLAADRPEAVASALGDEVGLESSALVEPGITLWTKEFGWGSRVVGLAATAAIATAESWCSISGTREDAGQLVRYFMHASKLRYEASVFKQDIDELRRQERALDDGLAELFALHQRFEAAGAGADELIDAQSRLGRAQGDAAGLLISITHLRDLRQTVEIAAHNLRANEPAQIESTAIAQSFFAREQKLAEWLDGQAGHEIAYLQSCRERVGEAQKLTELRLQQLSAANARTANWLSVLQTSLLAAPLGALSVATTLGTHITAPVTVRVAVMALVGSMTLLAPLLAFRWIHGYRWPEIGGVAVIGGCIGWVIAVAVSAAAPLTIVVAAAVLGATLLGAIAVLVNGRSSRISSTA
ncbi:BN6_48550 family protein [Candidatus Mycobacterium wuenschmannii]|uniref:BN6_48550 family protein n=1 Tax=Candidatus Mycobacterium wuenschmannii TaxID=3027808 RepID=A0ABY8VWR0_9MYCO|nr:CATRA conflict system CASPASE/TPR repeat-associated protein [Candidatus Mycobacterium wuenschmannii]WIM87932.1 BN6_48550 family protein [Candidatus Mycobacterium wuenschmannii]